ncbi:hypothetical protein ACLNGM_15240 [Aureimonas phyllosphaerae]|uniref:hypothetical protein n=1 Tax=Aureimonas phyllosphaerae TaxID=1166078 RepID=UPI003A5C5C73
MSNRPNVLYPFSMPPRDNHGLFLDDAQRLGLVVEVACNFCRTTRYYSPADMRVLLGNVEVDSLRRRLKCEDCGKRDYVEVIGKDLPAHEKNGKVLRKLTSIQVLRRPVWKDVPM